MHHVHCFSTLLYSMGNLFRLCLRILSASTCKSLHMIYYPTSYTQNADLNVPERATRHYFVALNKTRQISPMAHTCNMMREHHGQCSMHERANLTKLVLRCLVDSHAWLCLRCRGMPDVVYRWLGPATIAVLLWIEAVFGLTVCAKFLIRSIALAQLHCLQATPKASLLHIRGRCHNV